MNQSVIISQATIEDLDELVPLFNDYRIFYKSDSDLEGAQDFLNERFIHNQAIIFIARESEGNTMIGFTQLFPTFSSVILKKSFLLNDLFVAQAYRGRGVAELLLQAAEKYALQTNAGVIKLATALDNKVAQRLYERNGYKKDEAFFHYHLPL